MSPQKERNDTESDQTAGSLTNHRGSSNDILPSFFELKTFLSPLPDVTDCYNLHATLRAYKMDVEHDGRVVEIRTRRAWLFFELDGLEEHPGMKRFGDYQLETEHRIKTTTDVITEGKVSTRADVKGAMLPIGVLGSASGEISTHGQNSFRTVGKDKSESVSRRVIARPNCQWEFQEPNGATLDGTYLLDNTLCTLIKKKNANRIRVTGHLLIRQRYLDYDYEGSTLFDYLPRTKRRIFEVFLARILCGSVGDANPGAFFLSRSEIEL